jgi:hypothetical protein
LEAYRLEGSSYRDCLKDGEWSGNDALCLGKTMSRSICILVLTVPHAERECLHPINPIHGKMLPKREFHWFSDSVIVRCDPGYQPVGMQRLTCIASKTLIRGGAWSGEVPTCERK